MADNKLTNKAADAAREAADETARATRAVANEAARAGEQTARAGADIANRGAETWRNNVQSGLNTASDAFQRTTDQFLKAFTFAGPQSEELARRSTDNVQAVTEASSVLARGVQEVSQELFGMAQERVTKNIDAVNRLAGCRSVQDFVAVQSDLMRDGLQQVIDTNRRIAEVSLRVADEAVRAIQAQANSNLNQARRAA